MSSTSSPDSNGTSFPGSHIPRPSEDTDMQSVPENTTYNTAGMTPPQITQTHLSSRRAIERAENPDLVEPRSDRATNTTVYSTGFSASSSSCRRRQLLDNNSLSPTGYGMNSSHDVTMSSRLPTLAEETQAVAIPGMDTLSFDDAMDTQPPTISEVVHALTGLDSSSRIRASRLPRRHRIPANSSRIQGITRRNRSSRRNAMDALSGRPASPSLREFGNMIRSIEPASNQDADADDEAVDMGPPLPDPAMNLDTFTARRNVRSRSTLSNVMSTGDLEYENRESDNAVTMNSSYNAATRSGNVQPRGYENPTDQHRRNALATFTTPVNVESPSVASTSTSTSTSTSNSTTEPQNQSQATGTGNGTGNTTVSSRKLSQSATVRLWVAMYRTNDTKQQDLETMREAGVDDIPIAKLSIGGSFRR
ncbi:uncharacterized protein EAF02_005536 [Botrytis sinoallii]|uniref:uncharacterized protein n=1 Tax=Botrytis sinoallii TaxID=1463999 RepID=UPI0018FF161F|nr:uncharacterized protein EAF02_005536 [Botrytis sinoallii]KAF7883616.1 hypothetical protein EAF02_005536 [Botrytis sinoallii]